MVAAVQERTVAVPSKLGNLKLIPASETGQVWGLNMLVYGQAGVGKTTFCASADDSPYGRDVLYVDLEGGTFSISDRPNISVFRPEKFSDLALVWSELNKGDHTFKTVVIDSITELQLFILESIVGKDKMSLVSQQDWGKCNNTLLQLVRSFRMLSAKQGIHTLFTALEREEKSDSGAMITRPAMTPGSSTNVTAAVDNVGYLQFAGKGSEERMLTLRGTGRFIAKVRQPITHKKLPDQIKNPTMVTVLAALRGEEAA